MDKIDIAWHELIELKFAEKKTSAALEKRVRKKLREVGFEYHFSKSVYVIRMKGSSLLQYPWNPSPVIYNGRGNSVSGLASHIKNWASEVFD